MTKQELNKILKLHSQWLQCNNNGIRANLSGANLSEADLSEADLSGVKVDSKTSF